MVCKGSSLTKVVSPARRRGHTGFSIVNHVDRLLLFNHGAAVTRRKPEERRGFRQD
jgi:hypothetical protein